MNERRKGVITVEAALVMPVVLTVFLLIYSLGFVQYKNVVARSEAMRVANRAAANWTLIGSNKHDILDEIPAKRGNAFSGKNAISSESFENHNPYRFFLELFFGNSTREANMKEYLEKQMASLPKIDLKITSESDADFTDDKEYNLFGRYVQVTVKNTYASPIFEIMDNWNFHVGRTYDVTAKAKLVEPSDFVRNISYIQELIREYKNSKK